MQAQDSIKHIVLNSFWDKLDTQNLRNILMVYHEL